MGRFTDVGSFEEILMMILPPAVTITFVLLATLLLTSVLHPIFQKSLSKFLAPQETQLTWQFIKYSIWIAALLILSFMLVGGTLSLGIFIGLLLLVFILVSYKALVNFAGWLYIIFHHQLKMGDLVEVEGIKGKISGITMMNTILFEMTEYSGKRHQTNRKVMIPNSFVFSSPTFSVSSQNSLVWDEIRVLLPANTDHLLAKDIITRVANSIAGPIMKKHKQGMANKGSSSGEVPSMPSISMSLEPEGVLIMVTYFCLSLEQSEVKSAISENILSEFNKESIGIAFRNTQT
jgi:small-conductance mechanosensitive channel